MKIAAVQMVSTPDLDRNLQAASRLIAQAADLGAELVVLPEYFCLLGRRDTDKLQIAESPWPATPAAAPIQHLLAEAARRHRLWLVGGTLPVHAGPAGPEHDAGSAAAPRVLNRSCVFSPNGEAVAHYDKLHLFAFDNGRESYDEGRTLAAGTRPVAFDATSRSQPEQAVRVGLSICYDLRFPELYRALMRPPCDLLVVPAAFTHTTGRAHWEVLLRARAIENQCYVLASAQGGTHENGRRTFGHSLVVDPWGEVLACQDEGEGVVMAEMDPAHLASVRRQLPALAHRRL